MAWAAIKYHRVCGINRGNSFLTVSEARMPKIKGQTSLISSEVFFPAYRQLVCAHMVFLGAHVRVGRERVSPLVSALTGTLILS